MPSHQNCLVIVLWALLLAPSARADIIYDNISNPVTGTVAWGTIDQTWETLGDRVTFAPGNWNVTQIDVQFTAFQDAGLPEADLALFLYADNNGTVGTLLSTTTLLNYVFPHHGASTVTFNNLNTSVPSTVYVGFGIRNYLSDGTISDIIAIRTKPNVAVGSSDTDRMIVHYGFGLPTGASESLDWSPHGNFRFQVTAVADQPGAVIPEPKTIWAMLPAGLLIWITARKRRVMSARAA